MTFRRLHLAVALGTLCSIPTVLLVRHAADAQRRRAATADPAGAQGGGPASSSTDASSAARNTRRPLPIESPLEGLDPSNARRDHDRYVADLPGGRHAVLTLEPNWQRAITQLVNTYEIPRASVVVMDTDTGRVRAYVSHGEPGTGDLARDPTPPSASVFKIVTASALLNAGLPEDTVTCYSGGFHALRAIDLQADPHRDRDCVSLGEAFGRSANTVFGRRAVERLNPQALLDTAHGWGYGEAVPFDAPVTAGNVDMPSATLDFARAAAGFWHSYLSPIHAAVIAQGIARGGEMQRPWIVDQVTDMQGNVLMQGGPHTWRRAVSPEVAASLSRMMLHSVAEGTAFHAFRDPAGRLFLPDVTVGGKTGTLTAAQPYHAYTWFVGNAANGTQRVTFAVMVANGPVWRVRAPVLARQVLQIVYRGRATD